MQRRVCTWPRSWRPLRRRSHTVHHVAALLGGLLLAALPAHAGYPTCPRGSFFVQGAPLVVPGLEDSDIVVFDPPRVSTSQGCPEVVAKVRNTRRGTKIRARWEGCGGIVGPHRLRVLIDRLTCGTMIGTVRTPRQPRRSFVAERDVAGHPPDGGTWAVINQRIFGSHGCTVATCHGPFKQGNLDLRPGAAYGNLVDVNSTIAPSKKRVVPGDAAASFLSQKLHGTQDAGEGQTMPTVGQPLSAVELEYLDGWIDAGAPQDGVVAGLPVLPQIPYVPATPPPPPAGGHQLVLNGPILAPGEETEGCLWTPIPWIGDFVVGRWEFVLNPGTHHFAVYQNRMQPVAQNVFVIGDAGCFFFGDYFSTSGAPYAPYFVDQYPDGVGRRITGGPGRYFGLNAHYHNDWDVPIQVKVWVNLHPFEGTPQHYAETLYDLTTTFGIHVPPFSQVVQHGHFVNTTGSTLNFFTLSGHMHKRGLRFTAYRSDGFKLYDNYDWAHPLAVLYDPPLLLGPGDYIDYECLHDNGVTRPVKRDTLGNPIPVQFGQTTDDEMCILPGSYWR